MAQSHIPVKQYSMKVASGNDWIAGNHYSTASSRLGKISKR
jgi:hypothetical protein